VALYVVSDLHLDERGAARLFDDQRQGRQLAAICQRVAGEDGSELILLGDTFDFTAMQPPPKGLPAFFQSLEMHEEEPPQRELPELAEAVRQSNPLAFDALARLSKTSKVTIVPGNHDHQLGAPGAGAVLVAMGLRADIETSSVREIGRRTVVLQHGHEWDGGNEKPGGEGEMMTRALHRAVIPYLRSRGSSPNVRIDPDRVVALRPEEAVISVLQRWLDERSFRRFFRAFLRLLAENGALPRPVSWVPSMVTAERVRRAIANQDRLWERTGRHAIDALKGKQTLPHGAPVPDVLVFGHTHVIDWAALDRQLYVNLGTWTERAFDASSPPDASLPMLRIDASSGGLEAALVDLSTGTELQRFKPGA